VEKDEVKEISILLGAGFSKSLAGLPLAGELSSDVLKAFKNDSRLNAKFKQRQKSFVDLVKELFLQRFYSFYYSSLYAS